MLVNHEVAIEKFERAYLKLRQLSFMFLEAFPASIASHNGSPW